MQLIDTHFHLDYYRNHKYWYDKINELGQYTICVTNSPGIYHSCKRLYKETRFIKFALGYNPQRSIEEPFSKELFVHEAQNARYIGEVGLDFSKDYIKTQDIQLDAFDFICRASAKQNKLLSVHSRGAEKETLAILMKNNISRAIIHWYTGDIETLYQFLDAGYYFSINASMCATKKGRNIIDNIPLDKLLVESDGPFSKVNSRRFVPSNLEQVYSIIGATTEQQNAANIVWNNFNRLLQNNQ